MSLTLSPEHVAAAREWLAARPAVTRQNGEALNRRGRVLETEPYKRGTGYRAQVAGDNGAYDTKIRYAGHAWEGICNCPIGANCKHAIALMLHVLDDVMPAGDEPDSDEAEPEALDDIATQPLVKQLPARLDRGLTVREKQIAGAVDDWSLAGAVRVRADWIAKIAEEKKWNWEEYVLCPTPPENPWQAWMYLAHFLRKTKRPLPSMMKDSIEWSEVDALVKDWERRSEVDRWTDWLERAANQAPTQVGGEILLRVQLTKMGIQLEWQRPGAVEFTPIKPAAFSQMVRDSYAGKVPFGNASLVLWRAFNTGYDAVPELAYIKPDCPRILNTLLRLPGLEGLIVGPADLPLRRTDERLSWRMDAPDTVDGDYRFRLLLPDGSTPPPALLLLDGEPTLYITESLIYDAPPIGGLPIVDGAISIPGEALETGPGVVLLDRLSLRAPTRVSQRIHLVKPRVVFRCELWRDEWKTSERMLVRIVAESEPGVVCDTYGADGWQRKQAPAASEGQILRYDRTAMDTVPTLSDTLKLTWGTYDDQWQRTVSKQFPQQFAEWLASLPHGVEAELDPELNTLREAPITAQLKIEVEEAGIDWFDLRIALDVKDTTLTKQELKALLDARGGFVRLGTKGWRRLTFQLSSEDEAQLAELGLSARDFSSEPQRLHALQLAGKNAAKKLLPPEQTAAIERRIQDIRTRVSPEVPKGIHAELRPYQVEGFHFLSYLTANRFGGILADDMGLGKTLQTLTWLMHLRSQPEYKGHPTLVVCPKSVVDNWRSESARFVPGLRVKTFSKGTLNPDTLEDARKDGDLVVINYAQLRNLEGELNNVPWHTVILDEAQAIKNPESQTAKAAWALKSAHRLALSGTPIENRLLDLWSIMTFAMPGVLGPRASFSKSFDQRSDPFARRRLAARVRPFVLRRTKNEVARDLPERVEEDFLCDIEGEQATLYRAELKRARAALLHVTTQAQLDKQRFTVLTSLLRLRQICCHPALISEKAAKAESAKLNALMELLEPLLEEGHKVLVFSQFVEMLNLIRAELTKRDLRHFVLTGETEDRGALVADFQNTEGSAVFLISLRAGGFGLNLTAASYVVLFDPWWNPAVENQAIDRTHRIGQVNKVIAYRLLVKESIEEKIRALQRHKSALADDILGEESFGRALTLEDFRFLLGEEPQVES
jgi:hypothetical protein